MNTNWMIAILLVSLVTYGCNGLMGDGGLAILDKQMAVLETNLSQARTDLAAGDLTKEKIVAALEAQLAALQSQQAELKAMIAAGLQGAGIPPELAAAGGGIGASLLAWLIGMARGQLKGNQKLRSTREDLFKRVVKLENGGGPPT